MSDDSELLRRFADEGSEAAFAQLVRQRIDFVYGIALRQVGGDAQLAQEVAQTVFLDLIRKARVLSRRPLLVSWLYSAIRLAAAEARRTQARWHNRQHEAHAMQELLSIDQAGKPDWRELRPVLDDAMHELNEQDRAVLLLRFFEERSLAQVGTSLGLTEDTARKRVERALEKLRRPLARRGIVSTASALGSALTAQVLPSAPAGLAKSVTSLALVGAMTGPGLGGGILAFMSTGKTLLAAATVAASAAVLIGTLHEAKSHRLQTDASARADREHEAIAGLQTEIAGLRRNRAEAQTRLEAKTRGVVQAPTSAPPANPEDDLAARLRDLMTLLDESGLAGRLSWEKPTLTETLAAIAATLELSPERTAALEELAEQTRRESKAAALRAATVTREGGNLTIVMEDQPPNRTNYENLLATFAETMGPVRYGFFEALGAKKAVDGIFMQNGYGARQVTIHQPTTALPYYWTSEFVKTEPGRETGVIVRDGRSITLTEFAPGTTSKSMRLNLTRETLRSHLGDLQALVPDDF